MSIRDPNTVDLAQQKMRIAADVRVWAVRERGELAYRLEIPQLHKFFRIGYVEYVFVSLLDGNTTAVQACGLAAAKLGSRGPTASQAESIQRWLLQNELAYLPSNGPPMRQRQEAIKNHSKLGLLGSLNPFWMKFPVARSDRWVRPWADALGWLFATPLVIAGLLLMFVAMLTIVMDWDRFAESAADVFSVENWYWLIGFWVVLKIIHEMAHAIACHRHGGSVREMGVVLILFAPLAYVDVTSCWRMNSRWPRIGVAAAGMFVELVIAAVAVLIWTHTESQSVAFLLHNLVIAAGLSTLLFNANALMRFDGYFILADLIEIPNLYANGAIAVRRLVKRVVLGEQSAPSHFRGWRRGFILAYGLASLVWRVVICATLTIAASTMFSGAGVLIAALGVCMWFGRPLRELSDFGRKLYRSDLTKFVRGATVSLVLLAATLTAVYWLPLPTAVKVPAVAQYPPGTLVRSRADGFVSKIHVADSQVVRKGDLLLELDNRELANRLRQLEIALEQNELRGRKAIEEHDASAQIVMSEHAKALREQVTQIRTQFDGLKVVAPRDGCVVSRDLSLRLGSYVREGDSLLTVASASEKELVAVVHQDQIEQVRLTRGGSVKLRSLATATVNGRLEQISPRATDRLPAVSLAATEGGWLAVRNANDQDQVELGAPQDSDRIRLLEPHFHLRIALSPEVAARIPAGMRLDALMGYRSDPLYMRTSRALSRLWHQAQDEAK